MDYLNNDYFDNKFSLLQIRYKLEEKERWKDWIKKLPSFNFDSDWNVKIIPPFAGALIRFYIEKNGKTASMYLDVNSRLGFMYDDNDEAIPYYEIYTDDTYRYYLNQVDEMMADIRKYLNE